MDLNVNFQGLKYNFKKVQGCFCKITNTDEFSELLFYWKIGGIGPRSVDRIHDAGEWVHGTSLNVSRSSGDLQPGLNEPKGYPALLILATDTEMDDPQRLGWQGRRERGGGSSE
jgi:hypothetical protein